MKLIPEHKFKGESCPCHFPPFLRGGEMDFRSYYHGLRRTYRGPDFALKCPKNVRKEFVLISLSGKKRKIEKGTRTFTNSRLFEERVKTVVKLLIYIIKKAEAMEEEMEKAKG